MISGLSTAETALAILSAEEQISLEVVTSEAGREYMHTFLSEVRGGSL